MILPNLKHRLFHAIQQSAELHVAVRRRYIFGDEWAWRASAAESWVHQTCLNHPSHITWGSNITWGSRTIQVAVKTWLRTLSPTSSWWKWTSWPLERSFSTNRGAIHGTMFVAGRVLRASGIWLIISHAVLLIPPWNILEQGLCPASKTGLWWIVVFPNAHRFHWNSCSTG